MNGLLIVVTANLATKGDSILLLPFLHTSTLKKKKTIELIHV